MVKLVRLEVSTSCKNIFEVEGVMHELITLVLP
jgi:hypothetical protein